SLADHHLHGLGLIFLIRIEWVLAGVENDEHIHLGAQFNGVSCFRISRNEVHAAACIDFYATEKIYVGDDIAQPESPLAKLNQKSVPSVLVAVVPAFLITRSAVFLFDQARVG